MSVTRFLVSGTDEQLTEFHFCVACALNPIERRGQVVFYTCMGEDRDGAIDAARRCGCTMQEMNEAAVKDDDEKWNVVVQGEYPPWPETPVTSEA